MVQEAQIYGAIVAVFIRRWKTGYDDIEQPFLLHSLGLGSKKEDQSKIRLYQSTHRPLSHISEHSNKEDELNNLDYEAQEIFKTYHCNTCGSLLNNKLDQMRTDSIKNFATEYDIYNPKAIDTESKPSFGGMNNFVTTDDMPKIERRKIGWNFMDNTVSSASKDKIDTKTSRDEEILEVAKLLSRQLRKTDHSGRSRHHKRHHRHKGIGISDVELLLWIHLLDMPNEGKILKAITRDMEEKGRTTKEGTVSHSNKNYLKESEGSSLSGKLYDYIKADMKKSKRKNSSDGIINSSQITYDYNQCCINVEDLSTCTDECYTNSKTMLSLRILEKGDGSFNEFNHRRIDSIIGGSGMEKRPFVCHPKSICEQSLANQSFLYDVISMSTGPDGSLYVGDYNVIRRINPDGSVISLLYLGDKDRKYIYDLKISPADNKLYMAHAESYQIFIIEDLTGNANPYNNSVVVAGTGKRCLPGDRDICGDGGNALKARFSYPKGLAVSVDKTIYISDGQNIRLISSEGEISTLIGHHRRREGPPNPLQCQNTYIASQIQLQWPTKLELNPLDSSLHIVDDTMILRLTPDLRVVVVAGASSLCSSPRRKLFGPISDISFSSNNGNLYVSSAGIVYIINSDGSIDHFISSSKRNCICPEIALDECSEFCIRAITSMTIDGHSLYISDSMKILRVKKLFQEEPKNIKVNDPVSGEIYTFNSVGQHLSTVYCETGSIKAAFKYKKANNDHHLFEVRNAMDKSILSLERGYSSQISSLTTGVGKKITLKMSSREQLLIEFWKNDRNAITFEYNAGEGLLKSSRTNDGDFLFISNNEEGRVSEIISSTGENICYALRRNGLHIKSITLNKNELTISRKGSNDLKILIGVESAAIKKKDNAEFYITSSLGSMKNGDIFFFWHPHKYGSTRRKTINSNF
ncbi:Teneurin-a [Lepeophtheirus salmonis]|uniref:Teneurin-a n=1 Tax=Lepeophtheirus salmonis TaxID=72036 RepID=A0A7R8CT49_LEPSM|nr:Teneurin-a [Lepeophtheirus salmonis]CAF2923191.1 Teneurin-a [Lepeophtheirus salmonis]